MASLASSRELFGSYAFRVFIDSQSGIGDLVADFTKVSSIEMETSVVEYREAGSALPIKDPGDVTITNLTLETGASRNLDFYNWAINTIQSVVGSKNGAPVPVDKRNMTIYQYDRRRVAVKKIQIYQAWPIHYVGGEWDNHSDSVVIERVVLAYDYFAITSSDRQVI